jgi:hypothetical protein
MKTKNKFILPLLVLILMASCDKVEYQSLSFYTDYLEVPTHGKAFIFPKTGSGNYTLEVENPLLFWAEMESGWSNSSGAIAVRGDLKGEAWLTVTDNVTKESKRLKIKVTDNYEAMRIYKDYDRENDKAFPLPPSLNNIEWVCLINNTARDLYLINRESISLTDYVLKVRGKGTYALGKEGEGYHLTLSYLVDEKEHPTLDATSAEPVSYRFRLSQNDYALHRLNQNLNLGFDTSMPGNWEEFISHAWETNIGMEGVDTEYRLVGALLPPFEMPVGYLN